MFSQKSSVTLLATLFAVLCCIWFAAAWHPEKKVMKWNAAYFRPASYKVCAIRGAPCGNSQKLYGMKWKSQTCCLGLECIDAGHGAYCTDPTELENLSELDTGAEETIPDDISI